MLKRDHKLACLAAVLLGCSGQIGGEDQGGGDTPSLVDPGGNPLTQELPSVEECGNADQGVFPGPAPIRRLNRWEYNNTVRDLLGDTTEPANAFSPEETALGFDNQAEVLGVTTLLAEQYKSAAAQISQRADISSLAPCAGADTGACATTFIQSFGQRAWRRPLIPTEVTRLTGVFNWGLENFGYERGIQLVIETMLQAPQFLYRVEFGQPTQVSPGVVRLNSWEMASRLSYMLWGTMPDQALLDLAASDSLTTTEQVRAQAERLLADERAKQVVSNFYDQWLKLEEVTHIDRDPELYPGYSAAIPGLLAQETSAFINHVVWEAGGTAGDFFTAPFTFLNAELAEFYGMPGDGLGTEFERVDTDTTRRVGLLTQGGLLATHSSALSTSPVHRGKFIREQFFCELLPPPPDDIEIKPPDLDPNLTTRERFAQHSADATCRGCHQLIDPLGLGFEHYDAVGVWRDEENGLPIDASGEVVGTDVPGVFNGAAELSQKLSQSGQVGECMMQQWVRYAYGRSETPEDVCTLNQLSTNFAASGFNIPQLLLELTQTEAFLYRKVVTP